MDLQARLLNAAANAKLPKQAAQRCSESKMQAKAEISALAIAGTPINLIGEKAGKISTKGETRKKGEEAFIQRKTENFFSFQYKDRTKRERKKQTAFHQQEVHHKKTKREKRGNQRKKRS